MHSYPIRYFVYGRDIYTAIEPAPATALGYFADSLIPSTDTEFPKGELRLFTPTLTEAQQAPAIGRDFATVAVDIDFTT